MKIRTTLMILVCAAAFSVHAEGDKPKKPEGDKPKKERPTPEQRFAQLDQNQDGTLSMDEFVDARLEGMKAHLEGKENAEETLAKKREMLTKQFSDKDKDQDGQLTKDEMFAPRPKMEKEAKPKPEKKKHHGEEGEGKHEGGGEE